MKALIVYYSRTGNTRRVAQTLADRLDAEALELKCDRYRPGPLRYLRAGYDSVKGNLPSIDLPQRNYFDYDLVLLGAPIWTSYPALPLRAFLEGKPALPEKVGLFLTYGGHSPPAKAVQLVNDSLPQPVAAVLSLQESMIDEPAIGDGVTDFIGELGWA